MSRVRSVWWVALTCALAAQCPEPAHAQPRGGIIEGRVLDARSSDPLPGATVRVEDTGVSTATDNTGAFRLTGVPPGMHTILVTYLGRKDQEVSVTAVHQEVTLECTFRSTSGSRTTSAATRTSST